MKKIKGTIDRFEEEKAVITAADGEIIVPKSVVSDFSEGDVVSILFASDAEDTENSQKVAHALVTDLFKEE